MVILILSMLCFVTSLVDVMRCIFDGIFLVFYDLFFFYEGSKVWFGSILDGIQALVESVLKPTSFDRRNIYIYKVYLYHSLYQLNII